MTARAYLKRLAKVIFALLAIPAIVVGAMFALEHTAGGRDAMIALGYLAFFFGIPLWTLGLALSLCFACLERLRTVGLPAWFGLGFIPLVVADWKFFFWLFRPFQAPFFSTVIVAMGALVFWPERAVTSSATMIARRVALAAFTIQVVLACVALTGSLGFVVTASTFTFLLEYRAKWYAGWWIFVVAAAMVWTIVAAKRPHSPNEAA